MVQCSEVYRSVFSHLKEVSLINRSKSGSDLDPRAEDIYVTNIQCSI